MAILQAPTPRASEARPALKRSSVLAMLLWSVLTLGLHPFFWFLTRRRALNALSPDRKLGWGLFALATLAWILSFILPLMGFSDVRLLLDWSAGVIVISQSFRAAGTLRQHFRNSLPPGPDLDELDFPHVAVVLFGPFYLQYQINCFLKICGATPGVQNTLAAQSGRAASTYRTTNS